MWSSRRKWVAGAVAAALALTACGYTPVHAPDGRATALDGRIVVTPPPGNEAFLLARALEDRLGPPRAGDLALGFDLTTRSESVSITAAQDINRFNVVGTVRYRVTDASGRVTARGRAESFTSYSATGSTVATLAAERDANERLMDELAERILAELRAGLAQDRASAQGADPSPVQRPPAQASR